MNLKNVNLSVYSFGYSAGFVHDVRKSADYRPPMDINTLLSFASSFCPTIKPLCSITYTARSSSMSTMYGTGKASGPTETIIVTKLSGDKLVPAGG